MTRREVNANELKDADIKFISLVKRGANRIPFRVQKGDDGMFDLDKLFRAKADATPMIVSVAVRKGADLAAQETRIKDAGLVVVSKSEADAGTVFTTTEDLKATAVVKSDDVAVFVSGPLGTAFADVAMKTDAFREMLNVTDGFVTIEAATEVAKSEMASATSVQVYSDVLDDLKAYATTLAANVPTGVFSLTAKACNAKDGKGFPGKMPNQDAEDAIDNGADEVAEAAKKKASPTPENASPAIDVKNKPAVKPSPKNIAAAGGPGGNGQLPDDEDDVVAQASSESTSNGGDAVNPKRPIGHAKSESEDQLSGVMAALGTITESITALNGSFEGLSERVKTAEEVSRKTDMALRSFIPGGTDQGSDRLKSEDTGRRGAPPLLDTAFNRIN